MSQEKLKEDLSIIFKHAYKLHQEESFDEAEKFYDVILANDALHVDTLHLKGLIRAESEDFTQAIKLITKATVLSPRNSIFFQNLGKVAHQAGETSRAIKSYNKAIELNPKNVKALAGLGLLQYEKQAVKAAKNCFDKALSINPNDVSTRYNYAITLKSDGKLHEALAQLNEVLKIKPLHREALNLRFMVLASLEKHQAALIQYPWIKRVKSFLKNNPTRNIPYPLVSSKDQLANKNILVIADQGIGDEVMFSNLLLELLETKCAHVFVETNQRLSKLIQRSYPEITIFERPKDLSFKPPFDISLIDFKIDQSDLMRLFCTTSYQHKKRLLLADEQKVQYWSNQLNKLHGSITIGISWHGGIEKNNSTQRSIPLKLWEPLLKNNNYNFINLQYGSHRDDYHNCSKVIQDNLVSFSEIDPVKDIESFCALVKSCDLVISIDNSTVHFSASLGVPTWTILSTEPDWRWGTENEHSSWYSEIRLFRARENGEAGKRKVLSLINKSLESYIPKIPDKKNELTIKAQPTQPTAITDTNKLNKRALLLNDTTNWYHWGCSCTSLALHHQLRMKFKDVQSIPHKVTLNMKGIPQTIEDFDNPRILEEFKSYQDNIIQAISAADYIFINGEGTLHNVNTAPIGLLYLAYIAKKEFQKNVQIINHSAYPADNNVEVKGLQYDLYKKVYQTLDYVAIREPVSHQLMLSAEIENTLAFDCLPLFIRDQYVGLKNVTKKSIVFSGCVSWNQSTIEKIAVTIDKLIDKKYKVSLLVGSNDNHAGDDERLVLLLAPQIEKGCQLIFASSEHDWLSTLQNANLVVSGRFHHTIAASILRTPFIVTQSNTPKVEGMLQTIGLKSFIDTKEKEFESKLYKKIERILDGEENPVLSLEKINEIYQLAEINFSKINR